MNRFLAILMLASVAGCARFQPQPLSPVRNAADFDARTLQNPDLRRFLQTNLSRALPDWPPAAWDFDMLTLAALYFHPSLDVARAQWAVARGGETTAAGRPNPVVGALPGYDFSASSGASPWIPFISLDIPLETAGKRGYRMARSQQLSESARLNLVSAAWLVRSNLRASLLDLAGATERERLLRQQLELQEQILQSLEQRFQAGAIARSDLTLIRVARDKTRLDRLDAQRLAAEARARVADAIGLPSSALEGIEISNTLFDSAPAADLLTAEVRRQALTGRSDILAALADYAASQSALQLEVARQYPDVHLGPGYQYDQGDHKFTVGLTVELPLLNQNQGPIAEALARRMEAAARFNALQAQVISEIDRAVAAYRTTTGQMATLESWAGGQQKQNEAVAAQVRAGSADPLDLLNARFELGVSRLAQLEGRIKMQQALGALENAMQHPVNPLNPALVEQPQRPQAMKEKQP